MEYQHKGELPHFDHVGATFFVTFRLESSIAKPRAMALQRERASALDKIDTKLSETEKQQAKNKIEQHYFRQYDGLLDHPTLGERYLSEPWALDILQSVLKAYDGEYYTLLAYCVMSNHVHLGLSTAVQLQSDGSDVELSTYNYLHQILHRVKGKSARLLNQARGVLGTVWHKANYDTYIRHERHLSYAINYTLNNPLKAGLVSDWRDWAGVWVRTY